MDKLYKQLISPESERAIALAKLTLEEAFKTVQALGVSVDVPRQGHAVLNPNDFAYTHRDERFSYDYKVQL